MVNLSVDIGGLIIKNPVMTASGTCGNGEELVDFMNISDLGALVVKGTTLEARQGNEYPRMAETASGMLNTIGLQNKGARYFHDELYPRIEHLNDNIIVNVSGSKIEDYVTVAEMLSDLPNCTAIEVNISCPNVKEGGLAFGTSCPAAATVTQEVRKVWKRHMMVKLSPNVTSIADIAKAVEDEGADSVSLVNTFLAMAIDAKTRKPVLSTITGGLSGPAIKPIALRMVWQVYNAIKIPVIGMGGIMNATDAVEFMLAGSTAIQVGTATFIDPATCTKVIAGIEEYCIEQGVKDVKELIGGMIS
ncbi:MAG: dihydroorotate dehydrogenase [Bacteroidetes bacterium]|jgi:dihydroorotate dehydrogenase (NAD+) catalytic subunit|nr:dihydroorotate dehydrogenase [Bacteroidota bacterium]MBT5528111.1 dihydroorotate dehydrogenase [Cytophagia bacterium]MBT3801022.1 dihydroorotate dehydrogenase [Bacteroidota bacterium]MBT3935475.1 dihydroorotate dehydrogenase [Bacteroidota bacterium]MBT4339649.1 dihydroorotate dehydrogenase [Bacteroidota bacterium]